ncbi:hypothetical protein BJV74DRAFT_860296 [Russula compacta]|nr:hypothetical protein BJV74DRAFT_860296 [Russula compacta]
MSLTDNNPLYHSEYLVGPIETIVCSRKALLSGHLSHHDITEAYRTLSMRIRQSSCHLCVVSVSFPALDPLRDKGADVVAALRRDISRALRIYPWHTSDDPSSRSSGPTAETLGRGPTTYNTNHATDFSTLCHYALRVLSEILRFPALSSMFTPQDLGLLLGDVISIIHCPQLPWFKASKTTILSSWVIRTQRLPKDVLLPRIEDVILYLNLMFKATGRSTYVVVTVVDALNCIVNLLTFHQHVFIARLAGLLPSIFPFVIHTSSEIRHHAAVVLASLSHTLIIHRALIGQDTIETICFHTQSFLTPETTRHPTSLRNLPPLLDAAVSSKNFGSVGENSPWALALVASFTVLLGPSLFLHHGPLKLFMNIAQKALKYRPGRDLNPHVWRTFIWSMIHLYIQRSSTTRGDIDVVRRCILLLKQTLHFGLGAALITSLLEATSTNPQGSSLMEWVTTSVIDVIHDMLSNKYQDIRDEGRRILRCLTCGAGNSDNTQREANWTVDALLSLFLFDGSLLRADKLQVEGMVGSTRVFSPPCLSQEEILAHWHSISSCFVLVFQSCLKEGYADLTTSILPVWQSLLLVQAQRIRGSGQPTASANFALQLSSLLSQFLPDPLVPLSGEAQSIEVQRQSLVISNQLWTVVQEIFSPRWLTPVASSFLAAVLQRTFYLADQEVLTSWSVLCSSLIVVGIPNALESVSLQDEPEQALGIKRQLWRLMATQCDNSMPSNWQNLLSILVFPIGSWNMSEDDLDIWERVLECNLSAVATSAEIVDIVDGITSKCPEIGPSFSINTALRLALTILRLLNHNEGDIVSSRTLSYLSITLNASYPPQSSTIDSAFKLIKALRQMITSTPVSSLESVIFAIQAGLAVWIEDRCASLSAEQYNDLLMPLYDSLLIRLQSLPLSVPSLNALVPLLTSAFSHIPPPALGPAAFLRFFHTVHARLAAPSNAYSDELRLCIDAWVHICGGTWPSGMVPLSSSSQTQTQFQMEARSMIAIPAPPVVGEEVGEQVAHVHVRSIEHEVIPDSQCPISNAALDTLVQARGFVQGSSRSVSSILPKVPSPTRLVTQSPRENHESHGSTRNNPAVKRHRLLEDMPVAKRHRITASTNDGLGTHSVPLTRVTSPVIPGPRSVSVLTPMASPRNRLVMDCVEVVPLRELLPRRAAEAERDDSRGQQHRSDPDDHGYEVTPERSFVPRATWELLEGDEIVPETPDAAQRPTRMLFPTGRESGEQLPCSSSYSNLLTTMYCRPRQWQSYATPRQERAYANIVHAAGRCITRGA